MVISVLRVNILIECVGSYSPSPPPHVMSCTCHNECYEVFNLFSL